MDLDVTVNNNISVEREKEVAQSCPTLCNPIDCGLPGIPQTRILEWVAISFSRGSSPPRDQSRVSGTGRQILYH